MPSMDMACFLGKDEARINFMSATFIEKFEYTKALELAKRFLREKPKLRWSVV